MIPNLELPPEIKLHHLPNMQNKFGRLLFTYFGDMSEKVKLCKLGKSLKDQFSKESKTLYFKSMVAVKKQLTVLYNSNV